GPLHLSIDEFWSLTPAEIYDLVEGYQLREEIQMQKIAWHAANLMNIHLPRRKQVTVKKLLGKEKPPMTPDQRQAEFEKLKRHMAKVAERRENHGANRRNISQDNG